MDSYRKYENQSAVPGRFSHEWIFRLKGRVPGSAYVRTFGDYYYAVIRYSETSLLIRLPVITD